jgi:hypothetical protein
MLGLAPKEAGLDNGLYLEKSSAVNAVCGIATPTDFLSWKSSGGEPSGPAGLLIGPEDTFMERAKKASPITYVNKNAPPFLLIHGTSDQTVPVDQTLKLAKALRETGADNVTLVLLDNLGHDPMPSHETLLWPMILSFFDSTIGNNKGKLIEQMNLSTLYKTKARKPGSFTFEDIKQYDKNNDNKITREEFGGTNELFDRIDKGRDNTISSEDFIIIK